MSTNQQYTTDVNMWGSFIETVAHRLGNAEDFADRMQAGYLAVIEHGNLMPDKLAWEVRKAMALREHRDVNFSSLIHTDEDGEEMDPVESMAGGDDDPETMLEALNDIIIEYAQANLEEIVDREIGKAIEEGNNERALMIAKAWQEYLNTKLQPTEEPTPTFRLDVPPGESKGDFEEISEDADEDEELASADLDLDHYNASMRMMNGLPMHSMDAAPDPRPDVEMFPRGCWKALRETVNTVDLPVTLCAIWSEIKPENETQKAWVLRYFSTHLLNRGLIEAKEEFYAPAIEALHLPSAWLDCEEQDEAFGEDDIDSAAGEYGHISRILYGLDWEGLDVEPVEPMSWPSEPGLIESVESHGSKPWECAVFVRAVVVAAMHGASWKESNSAGWDAWRGMRYSRPAARTYIRREVAGAESEECSKSANAVESFTRTTAGKIVGLYPAGLRVNGKGTLIEQWDWQKAIPNANKVFVEKGKESSFVDACRKIGGQAIVFAVAFESAMKYRQTA